MQRAAATKISEIVREWHLIDVNGKTLGRVATQIAQLLMGKRKPYFVRNLDCGDYVVVLNAKHVAVTGNKKALKTYYNYSGYPGGLRAKTLGVMLEDHPERVIEHAVKGMLPQNRLRDTMLQRLKIFAEGEHTFGEKFKSQPSQPKTEVKIEEK